MQYFAIFCLIREWKRVCRISFGRNVIEINPCEFARELLTRKSLPISVPEDLNREFNREHDSLKKGELPISSRLFPTDYQPVASSGLTLFELHTGGERVNLEAQRLAGLRGRVEATQAASPCEARTAEIGQ